MHHPIRPIATCLLLAGLTFAGITSPPAATASSVAASTSAASPGARTTANEQAFARSSRALERIGANLPEVARRNGISTAQLQRMFRADPTLAVDRDGNLAYFDVVEPGGTADAVTASGDEYAPPATGSEFQLASLPGADKTIYLDFDGHVTEGTTWNSAYGMTTIVSPPYDTDGDPNTWSPSELQVIRDAWASAAEDFAPWNVNVTTIDPGSEALRRAGSDDTRWGARVVVTADTFATCGCGGHAYIGSFDDAQDEPTFVYNRSFAGVAEAISHEVGHMMNLAHDGTSSDTYYFGHAVLGTPGWAPIMGAGYSQPVTQWSHQEYFDANNAGANANYGNGPDDLGVISSLTNGNGFGLRPDDHGDLPADATQLNSGDVTVRGIIGSRTDIDLFTFSTDGGAVWFSTDNAAIRPNLDVAMTLRNSGTVVASSNPVDVLDAFIDVTLPAGTYTLEIDGRGVGSPSTDAPSGYSDYASLGQYTLTGRISGTTPDTVAPAAPTGLLAEAVDGQVQLRWDANAEHDLVGYVVRRSADAAGPFVDLATVNDNSFVDTAELGGTSYYVVAATDIAGNTSATSSPASATLPRTTVATGETTVHGTVTGALEHTYEWDGIFQTITETESGGKPTNRHDRAEHRWSIPTAGGYQTLTIVAAAGADAGDADDGFSFEWSADGSTWMPVARVVPGAMLTTTVDIGATGSQVWVRVLDTDRTPGQRSLDTIAVDLLRVAADGEPVGDPDATQAVASVSTSSQAAGRGLRRGVATVTVTDDRGTPVGGATVVVRFGGDFADEPDQEVTTEADGTATAVTSSAVRKPVTTACVAALAAPDLTYAAGNEAC